MDPDTPRWILAPLAWGGGGDTSPGPPTSPWEAGPSTKTTPYFKGFIPAAEPVGAPLGRGGCARPPYFPPHSSDGDMGGPGQMEKGGEDQGGSEPSVGMGGTGSGCPWGGGGFRGCWGSHPPAGPIRPPKAPAEGPPPRDLGGGGSAGQDVGGLGHQFAIAGLDLLDDDGAGLGEGRALQGGGGHNVAGAGERGAEAPPEAPAKAGCWGRGTSRERGGTNGGGGIQVEGVPGTPPPYRSTPSSWCGCSGFACRTPACQEKFGRGGRG